MTRTIATPTTSNFTITIPKDYIGKEIEFLFYPTIEVREEQPMAKKTLADFWGILSESDYQSLKNHTEKARQEWNRDI
jgi:hypothetical protein